MLLGGGSDVIHEGPEPLCGVLGAMPVEFEVQKNWHAEIWALFMALNRLLRPREIYADSRAVVQALYKGEVDHDCLSQRC